VSLSITLEKTMSSPTQALTSLKPKRGFMSGSKTKLTTGYLLLLLLPFLATFALAMDAKGWYIATLSFINTLAIMAFFVQFSLGSRLKQIPLFANIDWSMARHKQVGQWLGVIFMLHPVFILAPRFMVSSSDGVTAVIEVITAPSMLTGILAWVAMLVWILMSIFKDRLPMRYETWRKTHALGFIAIAILATLHITHVGRHGQFDPQFNAIWWALCGASVAMVLYNYLIKPALLKRTPFKLIGVEQVSSRDWQVTIERPEGCRFEFEPGQFVWLNTSGSAFSMSDHPFSITSSTGTLPKLSFIIRELGDYTSNLDKLELGQDVFIDGPYGSMSLSDAKKAPGVALIAGGAGIGPMLSLLRGLAERQDSRPIRLIYGNNSCDQMVLLDEIQALENQMPNFKLQRVCMQPSDLPDVYNGVIDEACIKASIDDDTAEQWAVFLCGPAPMITAVKRSLKALKIPRHQIHYEQLSF
jgi:predicted ferric reductase